MLYVYLITDTACAPQRGGLREAPLRMVGEGGLFALVSEHTDDPTAEFGEEDLWAHERVAEALMEQATVLPLRFGSTVADQVPLKAILRDRRDEFIAALERVRGAVEIGVRAVLRPSQPLRKKVAATPAGGAGPGTAYLMERLEAAQRGDRAEEVLQPLETLARESVVREPPPGSGLLTAAYLVDLGRVDAFRERVEELSAEFEEAALVCTGPWPPYSFTSTEAPR